MSQTWDYHANGSNWSADLDFNPHSEHQNPWEMHFQLLKVHRKKHWHLIRNFETAKNHDMEMQGTHSAERASLMILNKL